MFEEKNKEVINEVNHIKGCCIDHGCKYNNDNCPVVLGEVDQLHSCPECDKNKNNK